MSDTNGTPAAWHGVPRPEALDEALAHARGILGNPAVAGADHISGGDPGRAPEDDELETVPEHHNDLGDWCPSSGGRTADGTCPQYCRHADELVGFDAGERDEDDPAEDDPAELSRQATRRCALCGSLGDLEPINAGPSLACVNTDMCQLRAITSDPLELLARAARGTAKDVTRLSEIELAALRKLADAVRSHGIGADLAARRGD
jgi:hypothetical protein